jgi:hypothetical protein
MICRRGLRFVVGIAISEIVFRSDLGLFELDGMSMKEVVLCLGQH